MRRTLDPSVSLDRCKFDATHGDAGATFMVWHCDTGEYYYLSRSAWEGFASHGSPWARRVVEEIVRGWEIVSMPSICKRIGRKRFGRQAHAKRLAGGDDSDAYLTRPKPSHFRLARVERGKYVMRHLATDSEITCSVDRWDRFCRKEPDATEWFRDRLAA